MPWKTQGIYVFKNVATHRPILNSGMQYFKWGDVQVLILMKPVCETGGGGLI